MQVHKFDISEHPGETVGDITYRRPRADIVHGAFKPGQKLKLPQLHHDVFGVLSLPSHRVAFQSVGQICPS